MMDNIEDSGSRKKLAEMYFEKAYQLQMDDELEDAIQLYKKSIEYYPTAEAHTFLGWAYSFKGQVHEAIKECEIAIQIDADFGNPWNDIGAYMIELGKHDEAVPYLKKAMEAKRYEARHYPHMNYSRVLVKKGLYKEAITELKKALEINPQYSAAQKELMRLLGMLN